MEHIASLNLPKFLMSSQDLQFSNIIFKINKLDLLWVPNFVAFEMYFIFETKFSWNEETDTFFNVESVLLGGNFYFFGGYCSLPSGYCLLLLVTWWLLVETACYSSLLLVSTIIMNDFSKSVNYLDVGHSRIFEKKIQRCLRLIQYKTFGHFLRAWILAFL